MPEQNKEITPQEYYQLLKKLAFEGQGYGKTEDVWAYRIDSIKVRTLTSSADRRKETDNIIKIDPVYLSIDPNVIPDIEDKNAVIKEMTGNWGKRIIGERDPSSSDTERAGVYLNKESKFKDDYIEKKNESGEIENANTYSPNPKATRVAIILDKDMSMPASWGSNQFVAMGGSVAIRESDLPSLIEAIEKIERGGATDEIILKTLYKINEKGERVAAFDAYPMEGPTEINPKGFLLENYKNKNLKESTIQIRTESQILLDAFRQNQTEKAEIGKMALADVLNVRASPVPSQQTVANQSIVLKPFPLDIVFFQKDDDTFESVERVQPPVSQVVPKSFMSKVKYAILDRSQEQAINGPTKGDAFYEILNKEGINPNAYTRPRDVPPGDLPQYNATAVYTNDKGRLVMDISVKEALERKYKLTFTDPSNNSGNNSKREFPLNLTFTQEDGDTYRSQPLHLDERQEAFFSLIKKEGIDPNAHTRPRDVPPEDMGRWSHYHEQAAFVDKEGCIAIDVSVLNKLEEKYTLNVKELPPWHPLGRSMSTARPMPAPV